MTVQIRLIHPAKIRGKREAAGKEVTAPRARALGLISQGRAELIEDQGKGDRIARDTKSGGSVSASPVTGWPQ